MAAEAKSIAAVAVAAVVEAVEVVNVITTLTDRCWKGLLVGFVVEVVVVEGQTWRIGLLGIVVMLLDQCSVLEALVEVVVVVVGILSPPQREVASRVMNLKSQ